MKWFLKSSILLIAFQMMLSISFAQCPGGWAKQGGSNYNYDRAIATVIDHSGNVYVAGIYTDTAVFSGVTLISSAYEDIFLAKYDANGNLLWIKSIDGNSTDFPSALTVDNNNNVYMTGVNYETVIFDTIALTNSTGSPDAFVAKFDSGGHVQWAKAIGNTDWDQGGGVTVHNNNLYISGEFSLSVTMGTTTLTSLGQRDFYLAKMDLNGNYVWARSGGSISFDEGGPIAVDGAGNIFVTGNFTNDITISNTTLINMGNTDMFLAKYNDSGDLQWARSAGGSMEDNPFGLALDSSSNIYVSLAAMTGCSFGTQIVNTYGDKDIMLAKYDSSGSVIWVQHSGGIGRDIGFGVVVANNNKIYQTGSFKRNSTFGTITLNLTGADYIFLAEYDSSGTVNFVKYAGGVQYDFGSGVTCANNNVFVCGNFSKTTSFDSNILTADSSGGNAFIWKACNGLVGIDEPIEYFDITLYPNPCMDKLSIETNTNQLMQITLRDITSREVLKKEFANFLLLNVEQLAKGIYIYEVQDKNGLYKKGKVVKE